MLGYSTRKPPNGAIISRRFCGFRPFKNTHAYIYLWDNTRYTGCRHDSPGGLSVPNDRSRHSSDGFGCGDMFWISIHRKGSVTIARRSENNGGMLVACKTLHPLTRCAASKESATLRHQPATDNASVYEYLSLLAATPRIMFLRGFATPTLDAKQ